MKEYMVNVGLASGVQSRVPRIGFFVSEAVLTQDVEYQDDLRQGDLADELEDFADAYSKGLYGGIWTLHQVAPDTGREEKNISTTVGYTWGGAPTRVAQLYALYINQIAGWPLGCLHVPIQSVRTSSSQSWKASSYQRMLHAWSRSLLTAW
jgi:hypothetical protein